MDAFFNGQNGTAGTIAQMIAATPAAGQVWVTDTGLEFIGKLNPVTGNTYYWAPRGGRQPLYQRSGSIASPLATLNVGITAGTFAIPGGNPTIPANLLVAGVSRLAVRYHFKRTGATAAAQVNGRLGTNGTTSDNTVHSVSATAVNLELWTTTEVGITSATSYTALNELNTQNPMAAKAADRTSQFNVALPNIFTLDISGANVADGPFILVALGIELQG